MDLSPFLPRISVQSHPWGGQAGSGYSDIDVGRECAVRAISWAMVFCRDMALDGDIMSNQLGSVRAILVGSITLASRIAFIAMLLVLLAGFWGKEQTLLPAIMQQKLAEGMSIEDAERALAIRPGQLKRHAVEQPDGGVVVAAATPGIGAWVVPQFGVYLVFDSGGALTRCFADVHWQCDERCLTVALRPQQK